MLVRLWRRPTSSPPRRTLERLRPRQPEGRADPAQIFCCWSAGEGCKQCRGQGGGVCAVGG
eukprot:9443556-Alexandrium_andersonii.AAC.1